MMTVEEVQAALQQAIDETIADQFENAEEEADEGSIASDLFASLTYSLDADVATMAEVARREFGFVPGGARQDVADAFAKLEVEW